ncbi:hypothetical protein ACWED2_42515 [Amycolatopsis sp. NPDC005003]
MTHGTPRRTLLGGLDRKLGDEPPVRPDQALGLHIADWTSYEHVRRQRGHAAASAYVHAQFEAAGKIGVRHGIRWCAVIFGVLVVVVALLSLIPA